jgi:distribution and morphology protein 10
MGNISTTYAVKAGPNLSLCSKFDFNVYSYESDVVMGCELWRMRTREEKKPERSMAAKLEWRLDPPEPKKEKEPQDVAGVLKARMDQNGRIGLLWEGRVKEILFSLGSEIDVKRKDQPFRAVGLELQYSS